jgi:hypothetical protein
MANPRGRPCGQVHAGGNCAVGKLEAAAAVFGAPVGGKLQPGAAGADRKTRRQDHHQLDHGGIGGQRVEAGQPRGGRGNDGSAGMAEQAAGQDQPGYPSDNGTLRISFDSENLLLYDKLSLQ